MTASELDWTRKLAAARKGLGLSRAELARQAGMSPQTIKSYELGLRRPSRHLLTTILDVLGLEVRSRDDILAGAGFSADSDEVRTVGGGRLPFTLPEAEAYVETLPWPAYVVDDLFQVVAANAITTTLWREGPADIPDGHRRNLILFATHPVYSDRIGNWEELVRAGIGVFKGHQLAGETLENPSVYLSRLLQNLMEGDTRYFERMVELWEQVPAAKPMVRLNYRVVWRDPKAGEMEFLGNTSVCNEPKGLYFSEWIPVNALTWERLGARSPPAVAKGERLRVQTRAVRSWA